jgi:hypothetical protein
MAEPQPTLDLSIDIVRPIVRIDGIPYEVRTSNDVSVSQYRDMVRLTARIGVLFEKEPRTRKEEREFTAALDVVMETALLAPKDVREKLGQLSKMQVVDFFAELLLPNIKRAVARAEVLSGAGTISSRASTGSTRLATRRAGSRSPLASSART